MGKPQPRLTAAIVLALIAAAGGALWWTYRSAYTATMTALREPSIAERVRTASIGRGRPFIMVGRDADDLSLELTRIGFTPDPDNPHAFSRRSEVAGYFVDEIIELTTRGPTVASVHYTRMTDAPIKSPFIEENAP